MEFCARGPLVFVVIFLGSRGGGTGGPSKAGKTRGADHFAAWWWLARLGFDAPHSGRAFDESFAPSAVRRRGFMRAGRFLPADPRWLFKRHIEVYALFPPRRVSAMRCGGGKGCVR